MTRLLIVLALCAASPTWAQSGGIFEITRSTLDAGGSTERSPDNVVVRGSVGQPEVGMPAFGIFIVKGGFWSTQGRLGIFFVDGFESGDTTAWTNSVGEVVRTPEAEPTESISGDNTAGPKTAGQGTIRHDDRSAVTVRPIRRQPT